MEDNSIFLDLEGNLVKMNREPHESESLLQRALARFPQVLAGPSTQGDPESPDPQLFLIRREMKISDDHGNDTAFRLDHLFIDSEGVPVLVEVKRSSNTQIRRAVVAQMLDYAAQARNWQVAYLRDIAANEDLQNMGEEIWERVGSNLRAGRIRMIFVADSIPPELTRIIEFLNEQMSPAEVLGVELQRFVGEGHTVFVPRVVGRTTAAIDAKAGTSIRWTRDSLLARAKELKRTDAEITFIERLFADVEERHGSFYWGSAPRPGVAGWYTDEHGVNASVWHVYVGDDSQAAHLRFQLGMVADRFGIDAASRMADHLKTIPGLTSKLEEASDKARDIDLLEVASQEAHQNAVMNAIASVFESADGHATT